MNPALLAVISASLHQSVTSSGLYPLTFNSRAKVDHEGGWLKRKRKARLLGQLRDDAARKAMDLPINAERNERRWKAYFELTGG